MTLLTHYLPPYIARVLVHAQPALRELNVLLSVEQEPNRDFGDTWKGLNVTVQKSLMVRRPWKHKSGFQDELFVHLPYDTFKQLRRTKPDVVFSFELGFRSLLSSIYCQWTKTPLALCVCVSEHTEQGRGLMRHWLRRYLLKAATAVTYNGPSCRRYLQKFGVPEEKLFHFPYCSTDLVRYTGPLERNSEASKRFIYLGQLIERKGIVPLIKSLITYCSARPEKTIELDVVGGGPQEEEVRNLGLPSNLKLRLLGHMRYKDMFQAMESAGVMIFPTLADEWGLVVNEAMQAGLPVLGSEYAQACTTLITEDQNGWLYRPDHPQELHRKLDHILDLSSDKLANMRESAQKTVEHITPTKVAQKAIKMFQAASSAKDT